MKKWGIKEGRRPLQNEALPFTSKFTSCCASCGSCANNLTAESCLKPTACIDLSYLNACGSSALAFIIPYSGDIKSPNSAFQCSKGSTAELLLACGSRRRRLVEVLDEFNSLSDEREVVRKGVVPLTAGTSDTERSPADSNSMNVVIDPLPASSTCSILKAAFLAYDPGELAPSDPVLTI
jgi:hypothetical protein